MTFRSDFRRDFKGPTPNGQSLLKSLLKIRSDMSPLKVVFKTKKIDVKNGSREMTGRV